MLSGSSPKTERISRLMPLRSSGSPGAMSEVSRSTILMNDGVVGTVARRDCTYAFPAADGDDDDAGSNAASVKGEVDGACAATFCRPCDGRLNAGNASTGSCLGATFALEVWNSLNFMTKGIFCYMAALCVISILNPAMFK